LVSDADKNSKARTADHEVGVGDMVDLKKSSLALLKAPQQKQCQNITKNKPYILGCRI
jgi:hypothetical protein